VAQSKPSDHGLAIVKGSCKINKINKKLTPVSFLFYLLIYEKKQEHSPALNIHGRRAYQPLASENILVIIVKVLIVKECFY
jgi:hypothetical protein